MTILIKFLQWIFGFIFCLPSPVALYLMRGAGKIFYCVTRLTPLKKRVSINIKKFLPEADGDRLADQLIQNICYSVFEVLSTPFFSEKHLKIISEIRGQENLDLGLSKKKGVLLLLMHTGNYELTPAMLTSLGYKTNAILKATNEPIFQILNRSRSYGGTKLINVLKDNMYRASLKALSENEIVCLLIDTGALEGKHELFNFLGRKVPVATGWLTLAQRANTTVIPAFSKREESKVVLIIGEPLSVNENNRSQVMQKVGQFYESFIRSHPEQWAIFLNDHEVKRMIEGK